MPLVTMNGRLVLRCINEPHRPVHGRETGPFFYNAPAEPPPPPPPYDPLKPVSLPKGETTMEELPGWGFIPGTTTPQSMYGAQMQAKHGVPVRAYRCHVCGYLEFYSGIIVAPGVWKDGD